MLPGMDQDFIMIFSQRFAEQRYFDKFWARPDHR
jgi:hypothetical protein